MNTTFAKKLQLTFCLIHTVIVCNAQQPLQVGMQLPDVRIDNIINHTSASLNTGQLKGNTVILYFWNTWCGSCISSMPKLEAMQKKYPETLKILLITSEGNQDIQKLYQKREYLKNLKLPIALNDTSLNKVFPHEGAPHVVWVDNKSKICAITNGLELTDRNLTLFIKGKPTDLHNRISDYDPEKSLLKLKEAESNLLYQSLLTKSVRGLGGGGRVSKISPNTFKITAINAPIKVLYAMAYRKSVRLVLEGHDECFLLRVKDSSKFIIPKNSDEFSSACYCYELKIGFDRDSVTENDALKFMQEDLDRYFKVKSSVEKRNIPSYVVRNNGNTKSDSKNTSYIKYDPDETEFCNQSPPRVLSYFNENRNFKEPLLFEGSVDTRISIRVRQGKIGFEEIKKLLDKCGMSITRENREMNVLVISHL